jgi:hypothetical protein
LIQNRDLKITRRLAEASNELAEVTNKDSSTMRVFSAMTLILLPVSIVSTVFSSGIVDFKAGSGGLVGSWSGPAALWWAVITIVLTGVVRSIGERWRRRAIVAQRAARARRDRGRDFLDWTTRRAVSDHESWMTPALRAIKDVRASAQDYAYKIYVLYGRLVAFLRDILTRCISARPDSPSPPGPKGSFPHHSPHSQDQHPQATQSREQPPLSSSSSPPITSTHSGPPPTQPDRDVEGPIHVNGVELEQLVERLSPQQAQSPEISAAPSPENEESGSKSFDQASEAERGLLVRVVESKEEGTNGNNVEGQEP